MVRREQAAQLNKGQSVQVFGEMQGAKSSQGMTGVCCPCLTSRNHSHASISLKILFLPTSHTTNLKPKTCCRHPSRIPSIPCLILFPLDFLRLQLTDPQPQVFVPLLRVMNMTLYLIWVSKLQGTCIMYYVYTVGCRGTSRGKRERNIFHDRHHTTVLGTVSILMSSHLSASQSLLATSVVGVLL